MPALLRPMRHSNAASRHAECRFARQGALSPEDAGLSRVPHCSSGGGGHTPRLVARVARLAALKPTGNAGALQRCAERSGGILRMRTQSPGATIKRHPPSRHTVTAKEDFNRRVWRTALLTVGLLAALIFGIIVLAGSDWIPGTIIVAASLIGLATQIRSSPSSVAGPRRRHRTATDGLTARGLTLAAVTRPIRAAAAGGGGRSRSRRGPGPGEGRGQR
jgi:hypothetical protein